METKKSEPVRLSEPGRKGEMAMIVAPYIRIKRSIMSRMADMTRALAP